MLKNTYRHKEIEESATRIWESRDLFSPNIEKLKKPFSIFLVPPNASGPMHVGNALMVALQDILARYHRAQGEPTLWIPSTDHGGYETQVSFERDMEKQGQDISLLTNRELFLAVKKFVEENNTIIKEQLKSLGASVDWNRFRFTMDQQALDAVDQTFKKMVRDNLIYRSSYMVNYCPLCSTFLADIELKEIEQPLPLYHIKFPFRDGTDYLILATAHPEFLFSITHVLIHPQDTHHAQYIGRSLINPITSEPIEIIASKRKFDPTKTEETLSPFCPSFKRYDYEYALRNHLPSRNLLDWQGKLIERYPGLTSTDAREREIAFLQQHGWIEKIESPHTEIGLICKKGHQTVNLIVYTWFLRLDDHKIPLRKAAIAAIEKEQLTVFPQWRKKGLVEWMGKMHDWPIARQNVWGITIPIWYDVSEPENYMVWFYDKIGKKCNGNLKNFLGAGIRLEEIAQGLERIYGNENALWVLEKKPGRQYLPETDTFDTWFSSGQWSTAVFKRTTDDFSYFYPAYSIIIGHDLLRLSVSRKILLNFYETGKLPFKLVYLHPLLLGNDGQKMSKSIGNIVPLEYYLDTFGADVTRMALVSYSSAKENFYFSEERLEFFREFIDRLLHFGKAMKIVYSYSVKPHKKSNVSKEDQKIMNQFKDMVLEVGKIITKHQFAIAQEKACNFLGNLEEYVQNLQSHKTKENAISIVQQMYQSYLIVLHPFIPFTTEVLYSTLSKKLPLAATLWPKL